MQRQKNRLAKRDRKIAISPRGSTLVRVASLAVIAFSLALPAAPALAARHGKPAASAKVSAKVSAKKIRHHKAVRASQKAVASPTAAPAHLFKVERLGASAAAVDEVRPHIERFQAESASVSPAERDRSSAPVRHSKDQVGAPTLASRTVLVFDEANGKPVYSRNDEQSQPIASITKLMTAMVVLDAKLPMDETLTISWDDVDHLRGSSSRVPVGAELAREELLRLALMSSENRAASALGRNYPGGISAFVRAMNAKAAALGMTQSRFEDSTGLHDGNRASAMDLVRMVQAAHEYEKIREFTTTGSHLAELGRKRIEFRNTNALVRSPDWDIGLSKTGYIREAGRCLVMHARIAARPVVIVLLDGDGKYTRIGDANRIKKWLETRWRGDVLASNN